MEMEPGKLFIGGISWDTSVERLREYFQTFGEVKEAVIMKDRTTGRARGFGFVVFANASVAEQVAKERHVIDGRTVEAKKAVPRDDHQNFNRSNNSSIQGSPVLARTKKIFVGGLASTVTESDFKKYFDQFGIITDVVVMYDHNTQRPRGFGFITYNSEEAVEKVLFKTFHELNGKMVEVKRAVPKELSPGPTRNQSGGGYNYGLNRVSSLLNAYTNISSSPNGYGMRMEGRFSPVGVGRNSYPPYSPSNYSMGLNSDSECCLNYGGGGDSGLGYARGVNSYYPGNTNRIGSPIGPPSIAKNRDLWGNGSLNNGSNSLMSNVFGSGTGNTGLGGGFGHIGEIWGSSRDALSNGKFGYGIGEYNFGSRVGYNRDNGGSTGMASYSVANNYHDGGLGNSYDGESLYGDQTWRSPSPELVGPTPFGYELGAAADATANNSAYVGGYSANARSNRGIAA